MTETKELIAEVRYYSASKRSFYSSHIHDTSSLPDDIIEVSDEQSTEILEALNEGFKDVVKVGKSYSIIEKTVSIDDAIRRKLKELSVFTSQKIKAGFTCSALGEERSYPYSDRDQINLMVAASSGSSAPLWSCRDGNWSFDDHTKAQITAVAKAANEHASSARSFYAKTKAEIEGCKKFEKLDAITWA